MLDTPHPHAVKPRRYASRADRSGRSLFPRCRSGRPSHGRPSAGTLPRVPDPVHPQHAPAVPRRMFAPRARLLPSWWVSLPDCVPGSTQELAASVRGPIGHAMAHMCRYCGFGPGHKDWPYLSPLDPRVRRQPGGAWTAASIHAPAWKRTGSSLPLSDLTPRQRQRPRRRSPRYLACDRATAGGASRARRRGTCRVACARAAGAGARRHRSADRPAP